MADDSSTTDNDFPPKFYKYQSLSGKANGYVEKIICQHEIYFPPPSSFNDPFDCSPAFSFEATDDEIMLDYMRIAKKHGPPMTDIDLREDALQMLTDPSRNPRNPGVCAAIEDEHARIITNEIGVLCVSTIRDDILMWSHYGDSHRGICLEFDGLGNFMAHAQKVLYMTERRYINMYRDNDGAAMEKALLTKSDHWRYEQEWRLIAHKQGPGKQQFRPENLTGIIVGARATPDTIQKVRSWASTHPSPITLYQARINRQKYKLEIDNFPL